MRPYVEHGFTDREMAVGLHCLTKVYVEDSCTLLIPANEAVSIFYCTSSPLRPLCRCQHLIHHGPPYSRRLHRIPATQSMLPPCSRRRTSDQGIGIYTRAHGTPDMRQSLSGRGRWLRVSRGFVLPAIDSLAWKRSSSSFTEALFQSTCGL